MRQYERIMTAYFTALPVPEDMQDDDVDRFLIQRVNEVCPVRQNGSSLLSISDAHELRQVVQALQHRRFGVRYNIGITVIILPMRLLKRDFLLYADSQEGEEEQRPLESGKVVRAR